ncbi:MAG: DUF1501 domain-containing protein [Myxococcota bacterium]
MNLSRRTFLRRSGRLVGASAVAAGLGGATLLERKASAAPDSRYRSLVGVFLLGGNDANNLLIPRADAAYQKYAAVRTAGDIGIAKEQLVPLNPRGMTPGSFGLHPKLTELARIFNTDKRLALVCNVGTLVEPTSMAQIRNGSAVLPDNLMSHADQQDAWASAIPNAFAAGGRFTGWGGRLADKTARLNGGIDYPVLTTYGGRGIFGVGSEQKALAVPTSGKLDLASTGRTGVDQVRSERLSAMFSLAGTSSLSEAYRGVFGRALASAGMRSLAITGNPLPPAIAALFPGSVLGVQLHRIAEEIVAGASRAQDGLGLSRQLFSAGLGGFDTHTAELSTHDQLYGEIDAAFSAFYTAINQLNELIAAGSLPGVTRPLDVTLFTMSDFGRTFAPNSSGGSDHAWGSHALVLGARVHGGALYGTFPTLELGGPDDFSNEGRWLPSTSSDVYGNTLASWFGLADADADQVFPQLKRFAPNTNLGFV